MYEQYKKRMKHCLYGFLVMGLGGGLSGLAININSKSLGWFGLILFLFGMIIFIFEFLNLRLSSYRKNKKLNAAHLVGNILVGIGVLLGFSVVYFQEWWLGWAGIIIFVIGVIFS